MFTRKQESAPAPAQDEREMIARESCKLSEVYFVLALVKPADGSRGYYEITRRHRDLREVVLCHDVADFGQSLALYGLGNQDVEADGYVRMHPEFGQPQALRRITQGMASAADLLELAERVRRNPGLIGDGNVTAAEIRIKTINEACWRLAKSIDSAEIEQQHLGRARFEARRRQEAQPAAEAAARAEAEARKAEAARRLHEEAMKTDASNRAYLAEMAEIQKRAEAERLAAQAEREAAEEAERQAWLAEQERQKAAAGS